jgi:KUP system potassium uptake protein
VRDRPRLRNALLAIGVFGAALFYGDAVLTPAISVLSAVEGLKWARRHSSPTSCPSQSACSSRCSRCSGMERLSSVCSLAGVRAVFLSIGVVGIWNIVKAPAILDALIRSMRWSL